MNPIQRRRLITVCLIASASAIALGLAVFAIQRNINYLLTPSQVLGGQAREFQRFRLGGMVKAGSVRRSSDSLDVDFTVVDDTAEVPVRYTGILPDLFRDNQSVIATGRMEGEHFAAQEVLAKHDETYMPKELKDAMAKAHANRKVRASSPAGDTP